MGNFGQQDVANFPAEFHARGRKLTVRLMASAPGHRATPSLVLASQIVLLRVTMHRSYVRHLALPCKPAVPIGHVQFVGIQR